MLIPLPTSSFCSPDLKADVGPGSPLQEPPDSGTCDIKVQKYFSTYIDAEKKAPEDK
jgi:hypothetical protein